MRPAMRDMPAWGISLVINLSVLAIFQFIVFEHVRQPDVTTITSVMDEVLDEEFHFSEAVTADQIGNDGQTAALTPTLQSATAVGQNDTPLEEKVEELINPEIPQLAETSMVKLQGDVSEVVEVKGTSENVQGGVEGAMDRVAFEIRRSLEERKTLVIWAFDASGSLKDRRDAIAERFETIYKQLSKQGKIDGLYSAVVAYGQKANLLTPDPTQDVEALRKVVREQIEEDTSGVENVFGTVRMVIEKYRGWRRTDGPWNKLIFIVTDERGDDAEQHLEDVISLAKRSQTQCFTIGNAAIFGQRQGYVRWTYDDGYAEDIPVDQGPETAFPDGLQLPFFGSGQDWKLRRMSASYGPYALTRLCAETGGMYLITEESRGLTFDRAVMRNYAPDYRPVRLQELEVRKNAAKAALVTAAGMTYERSLPVPETTFRAFSDALLRTELSEAQKPVADIDYRLKRLFDALSVGSSARDSLREPRWRAAFDLAMGRLLAMRVRYFGYNTMLAGMKSNPKSFKGENNNVWKLAPSEQIDTGPELRKAAAQAKEYLKRVIDEHPGTPWAALAERELSTPLGWEWVEEHQAIPGGNGQARLSDDEVQLLLAEEEMRREEMRRQQSKPRNRPKL